MSELTQETICGLQTVVLNAHRPTIEKCVIICHGFGAPGQDLVPIGQEMINNHGGLENTVFLFPAGPVELDPQYDARAWWMLDMVRLQKLMESGDARDLKNESPPQLSPCAATIESLIEHACQRFKLNRSKIAIGGFSQGAMLTTHVALTTDKPVGGLIVWSGALINQLQWQQSLQSPPPTQIIQSHGTTDPVLPYNNALELNKLLSSSGMAASFHSFNGPHTISPVAIKEAALMIRNLA
jgi:phospholipase/carboxylesterase